MARLVAAVVSGVPCRGRVDVHAGEVVLDVIHDFVHLDSIVGSAVVGAVVKARVVDGDNLVGLLVKDRAAGRSSQGVRVVVHLRVVVANQLAGGELLSRSASVVSGVVAVLVN